MKKKFFLTFVVISILIFVFAISVGASTIYKTEDGTTLFSYVDEDGNHIFDSYEGAFPKIDENGNELTWYITSTTKENGNTIHTVASLKTLGEAGKINENGAFSYISPVTNKNTVSVNFPDNAGITSIPSFGAYGTRSQNNILFAYCPNTVTEFGESVFQETPVIVAELDDETPITFIPHKMFHEARNVKVVNIPASVEVIKSISSNMGTSFCYTYSLKTVAFAPNSKLTTIQALAFCDSNLEEIQFPESYVEIDQNVFRGCKNLKVVRFSSNFQSFKNVDSNGNPTTAHHSFTHTANAIQEVYIPVSFYQTKPDVNYRVSYAFDGCSNAKFFYTGTKEQLDIAIANFINNEWTTGATDHNYLVTAYNEKKIVTWEDYSQNPDNYQGRYIIINYNNCDAFYEGNHIEDNNPCVINCDRCNLAGVAEENPIHALLTTIKHESFDDKGVKTICCTNEDCKYSVSEITPALFVCLGYSVPENGREEIVIGYMVNKEAIKTYQDIMGTTLKYGVFAGLQSKIGDNYIFNEDETIIDNVINVEISNDEYVAFELKISGFKDGYKNIKVAMGAYVIESDGTSNNYSYMQGAKPESGDKYYFVSYNDILLKEETEA